MAKRWLQPDLSLVTCRSDINPPISCGLVNIWLSCSGGLPHCPCWFDPQQKTCPVAVTAAEWWHPATTCMIWAESGNRTFGKEGSNQLNSVLIKAILFMASNYSELCCFHLNSVDKLLIIQFVWALFIEFYCETQKTMNTTNYFWNAYCSSTSQMCNETTTRNH